MRTSKPLIGITCRAFCDQTGDLFVGSYSYYPKAIVSVGGSPVLIPFDLGDSSIDEIIAKLDGILLPGGADIEPKLYGEGNALELLKTEPASDKLELYAARQSLEQQKPLLAICRGMQILNIALGGTLYQDIRTQVPESLDHEYRPGDPYDRLAHSIKIARPSLLHTIIQTTNTQVNSLHHQAIRELGTGLRVVATSPDGIIEAVEGSGESFQLGVQFHPECLIEGNSAMHRIFETFVDACAHEMKRNQ